MVEPAFRCFSATPIPERALASAWGLGYALALALRLGQGVLESVEAEIKWVWLLFDDSPGALRVNSSLFLHDMKAPIFVEVAASVGGA